jgi:hypothetical protein
LVADLFLAIAQATEHSAELELKLTPMKKYIVVLISALIGVAFVASCTQQQGTTATTAPAAAKPTPTPPRKHKAAKKTPPKTEGATESPSPSPAESPAPTP